MDWAYLLLPLLGALWTLIAVVIGEARQNSVSIRLFYFSGAGVAAAALWGLGLALGTAFDKALGDRKGIRRYGFFLLPMDESLGQAAVDFGGRPFLVYSTECVSTFVRDFDTALLREFFRAFAVNARANVNLRHTGGNEPHHAAEAVFKAFARAVRAAVEPDPRERGVPSSKGVL